MENVSATLGRKRLHQEQAGVGIAGVDQERGHREILARLLLGPGRGPWRKPFQVEGVVAFSVAHIAASMVVPLVQEDRLNAVLEEVVVERGRSARCHIECACPRQHDRHRSNLGQTSNHDQSSCPSRSFP